MKVMSHMSILLNLNNYMHARRSYKRPSATEAHVWLCMAAHFWSVAIQIYVIVYSGPSDYVMAGLSHASPYVTM